MSAMPDTRIPDDRLAQLVQWAEHRTRRLAEREGARDTLAEAVPALVDALREAREALTEIAEAASFAPVEDRWDEGYEAGREWAADIARAALSPPYGEGSASPLPAEEPQASSADTSGDER